MLIAVILFLPSLAHALTVGDFARYRISSWGEAFHHSIELVMEVKNVDFEHQQYLVRNYIIEDGRTLEYDSDYNIPLSNRAEGAVEYCSSSFAGKVEPFTLKGENIKVCHFTAKFVGANRENYYGSVPFGIVKRISVNTEPDRGSIMELVDYKINWP